jgi:hypothetical protein
MQYLQDLQKDIVPCLYQVQQLLMLVEKLKYDVETRGLQDWQLKPSEFKLAVDTKVSQVRS